MYVSAHIVQEKMHMVHDANKRKSAAEYIYIYIYVYIYIYIYVCI